MTSLYCLLTHYSFLILWRVFSRSLLAGHEFFQVPDVINELSGKKVLAMELVHGVPLDGCVDLDQETRNQVLIVFLISQFLFHI